jgi:hypothetical protein
MIIVALFIAAIGFGAFGNWPAAICLWILGLIVGANQLAEREQPRRPRPSQLRRRQLDDITRKDRVR